MSTYNHSCKVCGVGYNACDTCLKERNFTPWRAIACIQEHFQVYMVLFEYGSGTLSKAGAKQILSKVDISGWENYPEHNRVVIAEILAEESPETIEKPLVEGPLDFEPLDTPSVLAQVPPEPVKATEPTVEEVRKQPWQPRPQGNRQAQQASYNNYSKKK